LINHALFVNEGTTNFHFQQLVCAVIATGCPWVVVEALFYQLQRNIVSFEGIRMS